MDEVQEAAVLEAEITALGASPTARQLMDVFQGYSDSAVQIALKRTGGGGAGGSAQVYRQTIVPADFAGRLDVVNNVAAVELDADVQPEDVIISMYVQGDSPGFVGEVTYQAVYAYTAGAATTDVNSNGVSISTPVTWNEQTYARQSAPLTLTYAELFPGSSLYAVYDATEEPVGGEDTIVVVVFKG